MKGFLFLSIFFLGIVVFNPHLAYAEKDEYGRELPEKIAPQKLLVEQLHKDYREKNHRYKLTVIGYKLENRGDGVLAEWKTTCGRFYSKYNGVLAMETPVIWGYEFPKENCEDAVITVSIKDYLREDTAKIEQKIFFDEEKPKVEINYKQHLTEAELQKKDIIRWIKIKIGNIWSRLLPVNQDAKTFEVPNNKGSVRG